MRLLAVAFGLVLMHGWVSQLCSQPPEVSTARSEGLLGAVKLVEEFVVEYSMAEGRMAAGVQRAVKALTFDRVGNTVEALHYDNKGELRQRLVYTFDRSGRPKGYRSHSASPRVTGLGYVQDYVYKRDRAGRITEYAVFEAKGKPQVRFKYKYDAAGRLKEERWHTHLGTVGGRTVHFHNAAGRSRTKTHFDASGAQAWKIVEELDPAGRVVRRQQYRGTTLKFEITFAYDAKGRVVEQVTKEFNKDPHVWVSHEPVPGRLVYDYNDRGRSKELRRFDLDGQLLGRDVWTLDERGGETTWARYDAGGVEQPFAISFYDDISKPASPLRGTLSGSRVTEHEYDRHGNWTLKRHGIRPPEALAPTIYREEIRKISYY